MKKKEWRKFIWCAAAAFALTGCQQAGPAEPQKGTAVETEDTAESQTTLSEGSKTEEESTASERETEADNEDNLGGLMELLGMKDEDTADLFGGGEENWTEDRSFYIGRIYQVDLLGESCGVYTTCGQDGTVESVSIHIVSGERKVTDEEVKEWQEQITLLMGTEPVSDGELSEGGSKNIRWVADGKSATMYRMEDNLSVSLQPAVGELE